MEGVYLHVQSGSGAACSKDKYHSEAKVNQRMSEKFPEGNSRLQSMRQLCLSHARSQCNEELSRTISVTLLAFRRYAELMGPGQTLL